MSVLLESVQISFLAMTVIFVVLGILIGVIRVLVHFLPYAAETPPGPKASAPAAASSQDEDHIAAIHAVLAHHLGKAPQDIHIQHITSL